MFGFLIVIILLIQQILMASARSATPRHNTTEMIILPLALPMQAAIVKLAPTVMSIIKDSSQPVYRIHGSFRTPRVQIVTSMLRYHGTATPDLLFIIMIVHSAIMVHQSCALTAGIGYM